MKIIFLKYYTKAKKIFSNSNKHTKKAIPLPLPVEYNIPEILPINCRASEIKETRFNLLIPALSIRFSFGGINTAIIFFLNLIGSSTNARIIITDETVSDLKGFTQSAFWKLVSSDDDDMTGLSIVCFGNRYNKTIPIRENDVFVATAWWTAYNGERMLNWQMEKWGRNPSPLVYLVQDFEPGFYKWSSRYLLALSTYRQKNMLAVVNTNLLYDFIKNNGIIFKKYYIFEPRLNKKLAEYLELKKLRIKKKKIIFYGRPSVERNAYEVIVKGLEMWSFWHPYAKDWEIISLGETFPNIILGNNIEINVKGKATLEEYANILLDSAIGISLMISPHPSYPPLEMAAFNLAVVTNKFFNKNLSNYHDNIFSLDDINAENIAFLIEELCKKFEANPNSFLNQSFKNTNFLNNKQEFDFIDNLKQDLPNLN